MVSLFGLPKRKISGENGISRKVVQNSQTDFPNGKSVYHLHTPMILPPSGLSLGNLERICKWYTPIPTKFPIREFLLILVHVHCRDFNIFSSHSLLSPDLVAQSVEQRRSNPKVVGSIPTLVRVFLCPCVAPFPSVGLTLTWFIWDRNLALHIILYSVKSVV